MLDTVIWGFFFSAIALVALAILCFISKPLRRKLGGWLVVLVLLYVGSLAGGMITIIDNLGADDKQITNLKTQSMAVAEIFNTVATWSAIAAVLLFFLCLQYRPLRSKIGPWWFVSVFLGLSSCTLGIYTRPEPSPEQKAQTVKYAAEQRTKREEQARFADKDTDYGQGFLVKQVDYGSKWPYSHTDLAKVRCRPSPSSGRPQITIQFKDDAIVYGFNGVALGVDGFPDSRPFIDRDEYGNYRTPTPDEWMTQAIKICEAKTAERIEKCFSRWDGSVDTVVDMLRKGMHDPSSFEHVTTKYGIQADGSIAVGTTFRGKNIFGALVRQQAYAKIDQNTCNVISVEIDN